MDGKTDLLAVFHLQETLVEVGPPVGAAYHVLVLVALVLARGTLGGAALLQSLGLYVCKDQADDF